MSDGLSRFEVLLKQFADAMNLSLSPEGQGLEFEVGDLRLHVQIHPRDPVRLCIVIEVLPLGQDEEIMASFAPQLLMLHRLNHGAWTEHDWQILIDDDNGLTLRLSSDLASTDARTLEELLLEGVERAQSLAQLWHNHPGHQATPRAVSDWVRFGDGIVRG